MIGYGDMATAVLALVALLALRARWSAAIPLVWLFIAVGLLDTVNAIIQSLRFNVFTCGLGFNWVIVTAYVPAVNKWDENRVTVTTFWLDAAWIYPIPQQARKEAQLTTKVVKASDRQPKPVER